jgi:hypothetical protein
MEDFFEYFKTETNMMIYHNTYLYGQFACTHTYIYMHHASIKTGICLRWPKQIRQTISGFPNGGFPNGKTHHQQIRDHQTHSILQAVWGVTTGVMA